MQNKAEMTMDPQSSAEQVISCLSTHMDRLKDWWKGYAVLPELDRDEYKCSEADQATTNADEWSAKLLSMPPGCQERMYGLADATDAVTTFANIICFIMQHSVKKTAEVTDSTTAVTESLWNSEPKGLCMDV